MDTLIPLALTAILVMAAIYMHYEVLNALSRRIPELPLKPRARVIVGVLGALAAHSAEVLLFALGYWIAGHLGQGALEGSLDGGMSDYIYFSYSTYTTVGYGDIVPAGHFRWIAGVESLTGFVLVTWTASYLYLEMSQNWRHH